MQRDAEQDEQQDASPIDLSSTARSGGVNIWRRALKAAANMPQR